MRGVRPSALPMARYCPAAARIATGGAGRSALVSRYFHAVCAGDRATAEQLALALTPEELEEVSGYHAPADVTLAEGTTLRWADADRELPVGLDDRLEYCAPGDDALTHGTLDGAWAVGDTAYVADIKRTRFTAPDGPSSLQLHAYGHAYASLKGVRRYVPGLWFAVEGQWSWGEPVDLDSMESLEITGLLGWAIRNVEGPAVTGPHCQHCYSRSRCAEYMLPAALASTSIEPLTRGDMTPADALRVLQLVERMGDLADAAKEALKAYAVQRGPIVDPDSGKVWGPVETSGRSSLDQKAVAAAFGDLSRFMRQGKPSVQFKWRKLKE